ncbi:MAG: hypothetical protein ACKOW3_07830 [Hyphomicrobium sp.]
MAQKAFAQPRSRANYINDIDKLISIADLLTKNPDMKRTTAIKAMGISDPSTIRRLRSKLRSNQRDKSLSSLKPAKKDGCLDQQIVALKKISRKSTKLGSSGKKQLPKPKTSVVENKNPDKNQEPKKNTDKPDILSCFMSANLAAGQAMIQMQYKMMSIAFQASPLACYLRSQEIMRLTLQNLKAEK